jgi:pre-mRNA-processing factor 40
MQEDLRHALKRKAHKIDIDAPYEEVVPIIQDLPEFKAMENDDEARRMAFSKFVKRQKEKLREVQSDDGSAESNRKRKEPYGSRMRERERDHEREDKYRPHNRERDYGKRRDDRKNGRRDDERDGDRDKDRDKKRERSKRRDEDTEMREKDKDSASQSGLSPTKARADSPEEGEI